MFLDVAYDVIVIWMLMPCIRFSPSFQVSVALHSMSEPVAALEQSMDRDSPGVPRSVISISEFLEDPSASAKLVTPEPHPIPPKAPVDMHHPQDTHPLRPSNPSPLESEAEEERENTRLVSIEEFLDQGQDTAYRRQQVGTLTLSLSFIVQAQKPLAQCSYALSLICSGFRITVPITVPC